MHLTNEEYTEISRGAASNCETVVLFCRNPSDLLEFCVGVVESRWSTMILDGSVPGGSDISPSWSSLWRLHRSFSDIRPSLLPVCTVLIIMILLLVVKLSRLLKAVVTKTSILLRFDRRSIPIRLHFDRAATIWRLALWPLACLWMGCCTEG